MKIQALANPLITSPNMSSSIMGMDARGVDMATYYLRDKIYSDKIMAVVREYVCNAIDEHVKYAIDRSVDFGLRTNDAETSFFVRDYAKGLSEHDIRNVFGMYFRSTKSSDNSQIGGLGIGGKSAFSYTHTFYVKSFHNGVCSTYACALGGGDSGIPVGHILKVSEEKTGETGLEISLEVKKEDRSDFYNKSRLFIRYCTASIVFHNGTETFQPETPVFSGLKFASGIKDGFHYRLYKVSPSNWVNELLFSSGNVIYESNRFRDFVGFGQENAAILDGHILVVDIPIGRMSLPISRESFENTPANNKVRDEIRAMLHELVNEDMNSVSKMTMEQLIADKNEHQIKGNIFSIYKRHAYSDVYPVIAHLSQCNSLSLEKIGNKFVCALIPNKASADYWSRKLSNHSSSQGKNYYLVNESFYWQCKDKTEIENYFVFKKVKSTYFNFPKTGKRGKSCDMNVEATVYDRLNSSYRWNKESLTALGVYNSVRDSLGLAAVSSVEEAKKNMSKYSPTSTSELSKYVFHCGMSFRSREGYKIFIRNKTMRKNLLEIGFFELDSPEYQKVFNEVSEKEKEQKKIQDAIIGTSIHFLIHSDREKHAQLFPKHIERAKQFSLKLQKILAEDSVRGKILDVFKKQYYSKTLISRSELRKILNMK
jgi:hypothetical protein